MFDIIQWNKNKTKSMRMSQLHLLVITNLEDNKEFLLKSPNSRFRAVTGYREDWTHLMIPPSVGWAKKLITLVIFKSIWMMGVRGLTSLTIT